MGYRTVRDAPTSELIKALVGSYDTARVVRLGGQSCILAREETVAQELDKRIPIPTAQPAPVSGWQDGKTAPVGERVLIVYRGLVRTSELDERGYWWLAPDTVVHETPSHWMPLPEVPR